jgi:hypothetical protein
MPNSPQKTEKAAEVKTVAALRADDPPATPDSESQPVPASVGAVANARGASVERTAAATSAQNNPPPSLAQLRTASGRGALTRQSSERAAAAAEKAAAIRAQTQRPSTVGDGMLRGGGGSAGGRPKSAYGDAQPKLRRPPSNRRR